MNVAEFRAILSAHPETKMHWMLPGKSFVPDHYHITEVGVDGFEHLGQNVELPMRSA